MRVLIIICCLSTYMLKAQEPANSMFVKINGRVVSAKSRDALASAIIQIKGASTSTFSDDMGQFEIVARNMNDTFVINMIGYKKYERSVKEIEGSRNLTFPLQEDTQLLDTVFVNKKYTGNEIIQLAIQNISKNYPDNPFVIEGLYRETQKQNNRYVSLVEATVSMYDEDYKAPFFKSHLQEHVAIHEIRKSFAYNPKKYFNRLEQGRKNWLEGGLLKNNFVRYLKAPLKEGGNYRLDSVTILDGKKVFIVSGWRHATLWVNADNFAIRRIVWNNKTIENPRDFNDSLAYVITLIRYNLEFKEHNGRMYLSYFNHTIQAHDIYVESKGKVADNEYFQELIIDTIIENPSKKQYSFNSNSNLGLRDHIMPYNASFWSDYKRSNQTKLDPKIIEDLEKDSSLDEQFAKQK